MGTAPMSSILCIIVHAGAGFHSKKNEKMYNKLCLEACQSASTLPIGYNALDVVTNAVVTLENSLLTNAGVGSNLCINGAVECDAGIMSGMHLRFAGVGCVRNIQNPIKLAHRLLQSQITQDRDPLNRVHPSLLVGEGALRWAISRGYEVELCSDMSTERTRQSWKKYRRWLHECESGSEQTTTKSNQIDDGLEQNCAKRLKSDSHLDTVGAVCIDMFGNVASAVSSGGIALKYEGRLGQACIYGCGCWAEHGTSGRVGIVTSGTGEQLIRTQLAQHTAERLLASEVSTPEVLQSSLVDGFISSKFLSPNEQGYAGFAGIFSQCDDDGRRSLEIFYGHTTNSMSIGYFIPSVMPSPKAFISRKTPTSLTRIESFAHRL